MVHHPIQNVYYPVRTNWINKINNTTQEKIYLAQKRIDELTKLINFWKINSNEKQST
tara:strand:+ start:175 stop:345 length:171 start_codon:yes stop_codon:yes gene_type:complete